MIAVEKFCASHVLIIPKKRRMAPVLRKKRMIIKTKSLQAKNHAASQEKSVVIPKILRGDRQGAVLRLKG